MGINTGTANSTLQINGTLSTSGQTITTSTTLGAFMYNNVNNTSNIIITLPTAVGIGWRSYIVKKTINNASTITFNTTSSQTIDGAASGTLVLSAFNGSYTFYSDGANWFIQ